MTCRTALVCFLAALLPAGCNRTDVPARATETEAQKTAESAAVRPKGDRLAKPVPVEVDGKPLVRKRGGLFPFVGDFYGDGRPALLLGYGGDGICDQGRLLIYRNVGTQASPRLGVPQWLDDTVPSGRIPDGTA
jgi:hypothetical protein